MKFEEGQRYATISISVIDDSVPEDAKYLSNHRGHLMFVRPEEEHLYTPDLVKASSFNGTADELIANLRVLAEAGYGQIVVQLAHGHEEAIEEWGEVFKRFEEEL